MFNNSGTKLQIVAYIFLWIGVLISLLIGGLMIINTKTTFHIYLGLGIIIIGSLISWFTHLLISAFGELVENSFILVENSEKLIQHFGAEDFESLHEQAKINSQQSNDNHN